MDHLGEAIHILAITDGFIAYVVDRAGLSVLHSQHVSCRRILHVHQRDKILSVSRDHFFPSTQTSQQAILSGALPDEKAALQDAPAYCLWLPSEEIHHRLHDYHGVRDRAPRRRAVDVRCLVKPLIAAVRIRHHHALQKKCSDTRLESSALQPSGTANAYLRVPVPRTRRCWIRRNCRSRLDHRIAPSEDYGQSRFQTALEQIGLSELKSQGNWGKHFLCSSLVANQTEHLVSGSKQLGNQSASENPSGTSDGYSQLVTPAFIFTLLILIC